MIRKIRFVLPILLMFATVAAEAQTLGGTICPDNINYGTKYLRQGSGYDLFSNDVSQLAGRQGAMAAPEYSPVLMSATSLGAGAVGSFALHDNLFLRVSVISLFTPLNGGVFGGAEATQGILVPVQLGIRVPLLTSRLNTLGYSLYGEGSAGALFGWAYPTSGSFLAYSLPYSRFTSGASAYVGVGNSLRVDKYVGLYLNGGVGYYDFFSTSFMPRTRYLVPSLSVGFLFNFM